MFGIGRALPPRRSADLTPGAPTVAAIKPIIRRREILYGSSILLVPFWYHTHSVF